MVQINRPRWRYTKNKVYVTVSKNLKKDFPTNIPVVILNNGGFDIRGNTDLGFISVDEMVLKIFLNFSLY